MKYKILLLFSVLTFGLFLSNTNNSALAQSNEDFATILYKTREEVSDITYELKNTLSDRKKLLLEMNTLTNDIDKVLLKFKNGQIKDCNNEIGNIAKRIKTVRDKGLDSEYKIDDFNKKKAVFDYKLHESSRLKDLVYTNDLYKAVNEFNTFDEEFAKKAKIYGAKRVSFENKVKTLPSVRKIQKELDDLTKELEILLSDNKNLLSEMDLLMKDMDRVIGKIDRREITNYNNEIKDINNRIGSSSIRDKVNDYNHRSDELDNKADSISKTPGVGNLVVWTDYNKGLAELKALMAEEANPKLDVYIEKWDVLKSKTKDFPAVRKLQNEVADITNGWQTILSDGKKFLSEVDLLIKDIDRVIGKIDNREITNYNNEIKDVNNRISSISDKSDDIDHRVAELGSKADSISKTSGVGKLIVWTDNNKVVYEWHALMDEEANPKWKIYNEKLDALRSKVKDFTAVRKLQNEVADMTNRGKTLLSDNKNLLSEMDLLMKDIDRVIGKIDRREITNYNNEIKDVNNKISSLIDKASDILHRSDELDSKADSISKTPGVGNLIVWTDYYKVMNELSALITEEVNPKWDIYNKKLYDLRSKVKNFTAVRKLQNELDDITNGWKTLLSDDKELLSEVDLLMKDIDRVIEKINRREITNYNNEIKDIDYRINIVHNKNNDISRRNDEFNRKVNAVSKTPGVGCMVDWTDKNKVVGEWNALMDEEDNPKWDIFNKKVETFNSITANLSNHP
ncbi:MAG: hypothetical protein Pg6B_10800 [Candidatus Azobacteroides pseudotrichonymphae]|nr:MAG: hypothetical protein Pg6B_10800 [Candidatus Azobacteroides pseudotrichonymphae]